MAFKIVKRQAAPTETEVVDSEQTEQSVKKHVVAT